ncbi:hypothetical protein [Cellulomonas endophytica]|uniref:hypothetical protein n=1 Tax=Cellulomonas endophytica TaxID=2494735 RepID=UPI001010E6F0|nr:hypothetical protein [Cellulomonas endophytica]
MLRSAVLLPDTALLVPGVAGRADPLAGLRVAAVTALRRALADAAADAGRTGGAGGTTGAAGAAGAAGAGGAVRVVLVAAGPRDRVRSGPLRAELASAGVPDGALGVPVPSAAPAGGAGQDGRGAPWGSGPHDEGPAAPATGTAVGLHLLAAALGDDAPDPLPVAHAVEVGPPRSAPDGTAGAGAAAGAGPGAGAGGGGVASGDGPADDRRGADLRALGAGLVAGDVPVVLLVVGSGSARHGPAAPLADDPRAPDVDAGLVADLADASPAARARLAAADEALHAALAVSGWGPWQVLVGAAGAAAVAGAVEAADTSLGALHLVGTWTVAAPADVPGDAA